ncbi:hypothetical protein SynRS9909_01234 [Synechococcus sp. RS9909]|nr:MULTISPECIES: DUF433 domain-containing protein [unclassified Synechococcus]EAQ67955.1 hypothetical protein RS9917_13783 [Synechococcus sp. RS9917]QNI79222.1 hypothetical protein SynRS9909_01234 [Synechococcus sp. RS9909]
MAFPRIRHDPAVMGGKPCIRGRILQSYPQLEAADIEEALASWQGHPT